MSGAAQTRRFRLELADLGFVYGFLCTLTLTVINPWGTPRHAVWTDPKVYALIALALLTWTVLLGLLGRFVFQTLRRRQTVRLTWPPLWGLAAALSVAFLLTGLLTVLYSPVRTMNAFRPHVEMGDGWLYWFWLLAFVLGNALLLWRFPVLFRAQLYGFLLGGALMALATLPQVADWRLDYTETMGQTLRTAQGLNQLTSSIYEGQMPIGLTSHRGHAAFVVAATAVLALVALLRGWLRGRYAWPLYTLSLLAVYLTATRGAQIAFLAGLVYLLLRFWRARGGRRTVLIALVPLVLGGGVLLVGGALGSPGGTRTLPRLELLFKRPDSYLSFRPSYWRSALDGIRERPLLGWGYNGFGLAFAYANDFERRFKTYLAFGEEGAVPIDRVLGTDHYRFRYVGPNGNTYRGTVMSNKAHNMVLDMALSVGLLGLAAYLALLGLTFIATSRGSAWGLEAVTVVYLVYGLTWFDAAQFTHLAWWVLSVGLAGQLGRQGTRPPLAAQPEGD